MRKRTVSQVFTFLLVVTMFAQLFTPLSVFAVLPPEYTIEFSGGEGSVGTVPVDNNVYKPGDPVMLPYPTELSYPKHGFDCWSITHASLNTIVPYEVYKEDDPYTVYNIDNMFLQSGLAPELNVNITIDALWKPTYWTAHYSDTWAGGGSGLNPYIIASPEDLAAISYNSSMENTYANMYFKLTKDIDMSEYFWTPIEEFAGHLDGDGHVISNLENYSVHYDLPDDIALINILSEGGSISNLGIENAKFTGHDNVAPLVASLSGTVTNCYATGEVNVSYAYGGGLVGKSISTGDIRHSYADVTVTNTMESSSAIGGFIGSNNGTIENCYARGNVMTAADKVGGFAGDNGANISYCYSTGEVTGGASISSGIGSDTGTTTNCVFPSESTNMKSQETYANWDFAGEPDNGTADIWTMDSAVNDGYPYFYNKAIADAKALLPDTFTALYGTHTNLLNYLNGIEGMSDTGVTLTLMSFNPNVPNTGVIKYTSTEVTGNVKVTISKGIGIPLEKNISVKTEKYNPPSDNDNHRRGDNNHNNNIIAAPKPPTNIVVINNQGLPNGVTSSQSGIGDNIMTKISLNDTILKDALSGLEPTDANIVTIETKTPNSGITGELTLQTLSYMKATHTSLELKTENTTYSIPARSLDLFGASMQFGQNVPLGDIVVNASVKKASEDTFSIVEDELLANLGISRSRYQIVVKPVEFDITCTYNNKTVKIDKFLSYVERTIAIPDGIDPHRITTGVVLEPNGTLRHVPTTIVQIDGKYYAKINSFTNSIYSVIYNPVTFKDMENHWAKDIVNDLGSRLIAAGDSNGNFNPDAKITRAEFTTMVVKALGLQTGTGATPFKDVKSTDKYAPYIETAYNYNIVTGNEGKFDPNALISRAEAMTIIDRMMKIAEYEVTVSEADTEALLAKYTDLTKGSSWAEASVLKCLKSGIMVGKGNNQIDLQSNITNAETAAVVHRLLVGAKLINE